MWMLATWSYMVCVMKNPGNPLASFGATSTAASVPGSNSSSRNGPYIRIPTQSSSRTRIRTDSHVQTADQLSSDSESEDDTDSDGCSDDDNTPLNEEQLRRSEFMYAITVKDNGEPRYCQKCNVPKPDRAHHCSVCGVCVLKMDHHCPWVNNCIGFSTQKAFLLFIFYTAFYCLIIAVSTLVFYIKFIYNAPGTQEVEITPLALIVLSLSFSLALVFFSGFHIYLAFSNLTTIESYERNNFRADVRRRGSMKKHINLFDLGIKKNLKQVFGSHWPQWFVPTQTTLGDGMRFPISYENYNELRQSQSV
ncbi:palmitoyltransferase for Vac8p [Coemansia sp. RSA 1358]|nr:palmitoyltransferase for Vac8p [Coemansia umbellata]KAJ2624514.1 palmitoyltransferase for Vac8p [Coemansia sp. RSA 1358]